MTENDVVQEEVKTFTQEEVDAIVGDRLKRERAKYTDFDAIKAKAEQYDAIAEASKSELQKAIEQRDALQAQLDSIKNENAIRDIRAAVASESGIPANLLTGSTEEECIAQAKAIMEYANPKGYPKVRDGGEITNTGKQTTRDQFKDWFNTQFNN